MNMLRIYKSSYHVAIESCEHSSAIYYPGHSYNMGPDLAEGETFAHNVDTQISTPFDSYVH